MSENIRILRYNTGTDKKAFVEFKEQFDAVIFNATIVAYSGASVADLVSMHKRRYIIDPQTHIFQQEYSAVCTEDKKSKIKSIKKSVAKYLSLLPNELTSIFIDQQRPLVPAEVLPNADELVAANYRFQTEFINGFVEKKEYDKYLKFVNFKPEPKIIIAPYFMLKESYSDYEINEWLELSSICLKKTIDYSIGKGNEYPVAAQLVLDKGILLIPGIMQKLERVLSISGYSYIFLWIDDFNAFSAPPNTNSAFFQLIKMLNICGKMPIMAYGGYESIILCNVNSPARLFGVAQSVGYGEYRPITPVGGGLPTNKYYFLPLHKRIRYDEAAEILSRLGYFSRNESLSAIDYYANICGCKMCHEVIENDINNFVAYNDSIPFTIATRSGNVSRNRPTSEASLAAAMHFLYCKIDEWKNVEEKAFSVLVQELREHYKEYLPQLLGAITSWENIYEHEKN